MSGTTPERHPLPIHEDHAAEAAADSLARVFSYHQRTKHYPQRYARSAGYLDWDTQPDPFRTYAGAAKLELPLTADGVAASYGDLFLPGTIAPRPMDLKSVAALFELALGLSAWKEYRGNRWALRCNPSSGNLHPTEGYAVLTPASGLEPGVHHYVSRDHCLERRCAFDQKSIKELTRVLPANAFLVGLSSIHWREAWKYGERAFRYCQHDVGHALAAVRYAAAALGWSARLLDHFSNDDVAGLLGLDRAADFAKVNAHDREHPDALLLISSAAAAPALPAALPVDSIRNSAWSGSANPLSPAHVDWSVIDEAAAACWKPAMTAASQLEPPSLPPLLPGCRTRAATLIRQRRSCLGLDGATAISASTFYRMLDHLLPRTGVPPWDLLPWPPQLHLGVFVHRVNGLTPGLYLFERDPGIHERLRAKLRPTFHWERPADCPEHLRLYLLERGDFRRVAEAISCQQEIAADGAFSLGMLADFAPTIRAAGAWWYRRLFWESGVLGQVLYLEAEAAGIRSTGIGCYFDDLFHDLLGLSGDEFQDLYHFTVGAPVEDRRLTTLPPYAHLQR